MADSEDERQYFGEWFLPENPSQKVTGTFTYRRGQGASLVALGSPREFGGALPYSEKANEIMLGNIDRQGPVTLHRCWPISQTMVVGYEGPEALAYLVERAYLGFHFGSADEVRFSTIEIHLSGLETWVGLGGFHEQFQDGRSMIVHDWPEPLQIPTTTIPSMRIEFSYQGLPLHPVSTAKLTQHVYFRAEDPDERSIENWLDIVAQLQMFLVFASGGHVRVTQIWGSSSTITRSGSEPYRRVKVLPAHDAYEHERQVARHKFLFTRADLKQGGPSVIAQWLDMWPSLGPLMSQYCGTLYNPWMFPEQRFLSLAQCLESFHLRFMKTQNISRGSHEKKTLRVRLDDIIGRFPELVLQFIYPVRSRIVDDIVQTRNYFTHLDPKKAARALSGDELFLLTERMSILVQGCLMSELGISNDEIRDLVVRRKSTELAVGRFG